MFTPDVSSQRLIDRARRAPRLGADEERALIRAWREQRNRAALDRLVQCNQRDVVFTALKFRHYGVPVGDLISEGNVGLMKAVERFDEHAGTRFATYANYWIRAEIVSAVMGDWSLLSGRSGALHSRLFFKLRKARSRLQSSCLPSEVLTQLAQRFAVSEERMQQMLDQLDSRTAGIDADAVENGALLLDRMEAQGDQETTLASIQRQQLVQRAVASVQKRLSRREKLILKRRLLADEDEHLTLSQLGAWLGVSRERVRQLEQRVKDKIKQEMLRGQTATQNDEMDLAA